MSSNRIIGINGKLPWRLPKDRKAFKALTANKILIIGRRTFEENPLRRHIDHAAAAIVLSKTLGKEIENETIKVVRSFREALHVARMLDEQATMDDSDSSLGCWVAGGSAVYNEALTHPCARELRLTIVDSEIQVLPHQQSALFPAKYRWDNKFKEVSKEECTDGGLTFSRYVFERLKGP
jgi:dihydrofolate reductase